ncbi:MAG: hypothetical protein LBG44_04905 [Gemmatimonadota bacterium]|jgi:hypothetical protein|nr:hypothetical protein [Gemmatimonadota bacterium]
MSKELRIAFAMGGGVSLGTFSGAALSQTLKLAVLTAHFKGMDRVVVDAFSGASAGTMALAVMLRTLVHRTPAQESAAMLSLNEEFGVSLIESLPAGVRGDLIAAQVVQDVQARVWGEDISLTRLLGNAPSGKKNLKYEPSILDRGAVEEIAINTLGFPHGVVLNQRRLIGDRTLFAAALSNITPVLLDARGDLNALEFGLLGLSDGLTSRSHRELRIFDLNFGVVREGETDHEERYPLRWCRYHNAPEREGSIGDIRQHRAWARIAATAIASGAFPFAFGPVVLKRKRYEYGDKLWPASLQDRQEHPFSYIDGGAFNNEPIREAFRLGSTMDALSPNEKGLRWVVFVDPNVQQPTINLQVPGHREYFVQDPDFTGRLDGYDLVRKASLDRVLAHVPSIVGMIMSESSVIEGDRIFQTRERFTIRNQIRSFINGAVVSQPTAVQLADLARFITETLNADEQNSLLPPGGLTLRKELIRVVSEESDVLGALASTLSAVPEPGDGGFDSWLETLFKNNRGLWLRALLFVAVDLVMELEGKRDSVLLAIAPVRVVDGQREIVSLPGGRIFGFGGFCSSVPRAFELRFGRYCAHEFLRQSNLLPAGMLPDPVAVDDLSADEMRRYTDDLKTGLEALSERVGSMVEDPSLINFPVLGKVVLSFVAKKVRSIIRELDSDAPTGFPCEFRIRVPDASYQIGKGGFGIGDRDIEAIRIGESWYLVTCLEYFEQNGGCWKGPLIDQGKQTLPISRERVGIDQMIRTVELPGAAQMDAVRKCPNPMFVMELEAADLRTNLPAVGAGRWSVETGVVALEDLLTLKMIPAVVPDVSVAMNQKLPPVSIPVPGTGPA